VFSPTVGSVDQPNKAFKSDSKCLAFFGSRLRCNGLGSVVVLLTS